MGDQPLSTTRSRQLRRYIYETNKQSTSYENTCLNIANNLVFAVWLRRDPGVCSVEEVQPREALGEASRQSSLLRRSLSPYGTIGNRNLSGVLIRHRPTHRPAQVDLPYLRSEQAGADRAFAPAPTGA